MKKCIYILFSIFLGALYSCEKVSLGEYTGEPYVDFFGDDDGNQILQSHEVLFYYKKANVLRDTIYLPLVARAMVPSKDCQVMLRAFFNTAQDGFLSAGKEAVAGVHYVPFDSDEMKKLLTFHSGKLLDSIPIILLRDASLKEEMYRLTIRLVDTEDIKATDKREDTDVNHTSVVIYISDRLSQPKNWLDYGFFLGNYGYSKHDFIVRHSNQKWDYNFIEDISSDEYIKYYYLYKFRNELKEENLDRENRGLGKLAEKDGTLVEFPAY
jgi:hypothetical protein